MPIPADGLERDSSEDWKDVGCILGIGPCKTGMESETPVREWCDETAWKLWVTELVTLSEESDDDFSFSLMTLKKRLVSITVRPMTEI